MSAVDGKNALLKIAQAAQTDLAERLRLASNEANRTASREMLTLRHRLLDMVDHGVGIEEIGSRGDGYVMDVAVNCLASLSSAVDDWYNTQRLAT